MSNPWRLPRQRRYRLCERSRPPGRVCLGNGDGTFGTPGNECGDIIAGVVSTSFGVALGDVNGDAFLDAVVANNGQPNRLCLGDGTGSFTCSDVSADSNSNNGVALAAPASVGVGGSATGLSLRSVVCRNFTTGEAVSIFIPEGKNSWDCEAEGLEVLPGDIILMFEAGIAE